MSAAADCFSIAVELGNPNSCKFEGRMPVPLSVLGYRVRPYLVARAGAGRKGQARYFIAMRINVENLNPSEWDRVNEATLAIKTGRIVVAGCTDYFPDALRIEVEPGDYHVVVGYRRLEEVSEDGLDGEDSYHVFLSKI